MKDNRITLRSLLVGSFFAALFAALSIYVTSHVGIIFSSAQIPVLPYLLLILMVFLLNPLLRLLRFIRAFSMVELMVVFIMGMVSAGIPNFGLVEQIIPVAGSLFSREWNNPQSEWNRYVVPYINDAYFISEPGTQQAAADYHALRQAWVEKDLAYRSAERVIGRRALAAAAAEALNRLEEETGAEPTRQQRLALRRSRLDLENMRTEVAAAESSWQEFTAKGHPELSVVLQDYPEELARKTAGVESARLHLEQLEEKAFEKVTLFRRGLPQNMSAYPGIFPLPQDDWSSYTARMRRLREGRVALSQLKEARDLASSDEARAAKLLLQAEEVLAPMADEVVHHERLELLRIEEEAQLVQHKHLDETLSDLNERRRRAYRGEALAFERDIRGVMRDLKRLEERGLRLRQMRERYTREYDVAHNIAELMQALADLRAGFETGEISSSALRGKINGLLPVFASADISLRRYFIGEVPWHIWVRPLARWGLLILLTYVALMSLNVLIFRQWAHNEMITYPLAELPKALVYTREEGRIPEIFRNGLFWAGLSISGIALGWNLLCRSQWMPGLVQFNLVNGWSAYVANTPFQVLMSWKSEIFFTMIGLAFLIPKNISFSLWFFYLLYAVQLLVMYWSGYIDNEGGSQWWYLANIKTSMGAGAMFVFASVVFFKCRHYILCALRPSVIKDLAVDEQRELRISSVAFLGASLGVILQLWLDMGANLFYSIYFYVVILLITLAMVRAVAEGGLLAVKTYINPFHYLRAFVGFDKSFSSVTLFTPLLLYCGILFLDLKVFIAPAMANAIKLRDDFRMRRGTFHLAVALAIVLAAGVATVTSLLMSYDRGADGMSRWFYTGWPRSSFNTLTNISRNPPQASIPSAMWMLGGGAFTAIIMFSRQFLFWMPHPLGLVMLVNPIMPAYWFSIFLGWLANSAITKYGHKSTYARATGFFIGLIIGELLIVILSAIVSMATGVNIRIDLNRH